MNESIEELEDHLRRVIILRDLPANIIFVNAQGANNMFLMHNVKQEERQQALNIFVNNCTLIFAHFFRFLRYANVSLTFNLTWRELISIVTPLGTLCTLPLLLV